jgi:hypothetical protein
VFTTIIFIHVTSETDCIIINKKMEPPDGYLQNKCLNTTPRPSGSGRKLEHVSVSSTYRVEKIPLCCGSNSWVVVIIGREMAGEEGVSILLLLLLLLLLPVILVLGFRVRSNK